MIENLTGVTGLDSENPEDAEAVPLSRLERMEQYFASLEELQQRGVRRCSRGGAVFDPQGRQQHLGTYVV